MAACAAGPPEQSLPSPDGAGVGSVGGMATIPTPDEAVERAKRAQEKRIETVRTLAEARQHVTDEQERANRERAELEARIKERMREFESADLKAYNSATAAGWSSEELRKIGFPEPDKKRRVRRRSTSRTRQHGSQDDAASQGTNDRAGQESARTDERSGESV